MAISKPMSPARIKAIRRKSHAIAARNEEAFAARNEEAFDALYAEREKAKKRKATRKAQKRQAFAKQVAAEVLKMMKGHYRARL